MQIDVDRALPVLEGQVEEPPVHLDTGPVDQDGHRAEPVAYLRECFVDLRTVGDVDGELEFASGGPDIEHGDLVAVLAQSLGDRLSDPGSPSGDESSPHDHASSPTIVVRCISRGESASYFCARCSMPVLSHMTKSPTSHSWR